MSSIDSELAQNETQEETGDNMPPPSKVLQGLRIANSLLFFVIDPSLEVENVVLAESGTVEADQVPFIEHEIECPRCHDTMLLYSQFDNLYYVCEECDFCLYTIKK